MAINDNTAKWRVKKLGNIIGSNGYWQPNEEVKVGTIRFPMGEDNIGYVLECVEAGTTGEEQPTLIGEELANYAEVGRVGQVRVIFNLAEKDVDEVMAMGITYSRLTYPELWEWAGKRAGLIISEEEWQAKFAESNGKFVPYYSSGDGSSTFRTPLLGAYLKGAENSADVGKYVDAGLPNITGHIGTNIDTNGSYHAEMVGFGAFYTGGAYGNNFSMTKTSDGKAQFVFLDASRSSSVYGNSDTVTPETMTGIWVIKAVGVVVDSGETDIAQVLTTTEQVQERLSVVEDTKANLGALSMPSNNRITLNISFRLMDDNKRWMGEYDAPADGWLVIANKGSTNTSSPHFFLLVINGVVCNGVEANNSNSYLSCITPVTKGSSVFIQTTRDTENTTDFYFIYAQSEV